jgi:hypothetical protein
VPFSDQKRYGSGYKSDITIEKGMQLEEIKGLGIRIAPFNWTFTSY